MKGLGFVLMFITFGAYLLLIKTIWRMVGESRQVDATTRFNRLWWMPAWKIHRHAFPQSKLRRRIGLIWAACYVLMIAAMMCLAYAQLHPLPVRR